MKAASLTAVLLSQIESEIVERLATYKAVNEVLREYENALTRYVIDAANGNMSGGEMSRAHKALIRRLAPNAYDEGLREGGVSDPEGERTDDDDSTIDAWIGEQSEFTLQFARDAASVSKLSGDEKTNARQTLLARIDDWVNSLRTLANKGFASAQANMSVTWELGDAEDNCPTCKGLNGKTHRLKWFTQRGYYPGEPGSATLDCRGYNCTCRLTDSKGRQVLP